MDIISLLQYTFGKVMETFSHNWLLLVISILISAALKLYIDQDAIARFLRRNARNSVLLSTGVAVGTPFCSCGTTAVVLGMMASTVPWAPIVAFLVASPLTSPQELFYSAGLFGWNFAIAFFVASILLGLVGGAIASFAESRGWLANQARMAALKSAILFLWASWADLRPLLCRSPCRPAAETSPMWMLLQSDGIASPVSQPTMEPAKTCCHIQHAFIQEVYNISKRLVPLFFGFTFVGYLLNGSDSRGLDHQPVRCRSCLQHSACCDTGIALLHQHRSILASRPRHARKRHEPGCGACLPHHRRRDIHGCAGRRADHRSLACDRDCHRHALGWIHPHRICLQPVRYIIS